MYRRKKVSLLNALFNAPWWVGIIAAIAIYCFFFLGFDHIRLPGSAGNQYVGMIDRAIHVAAFRHLAWILIGLCLIGAAGSGLRSRSRAMLLDRQRDLNSIRAMSWQSFERLVGEAYRRRGYAVDEVGQGGADGGVDLMLRKDGRKVIVQCKQWKANSVGAPVVRELFGLMVHHGAQEVKIVCVAKFTKDAREFAKGKAIDLVDGEALLQLVKEGQQGGATQSPETNLQNTAVLCPRCGGGVIRRVNRTTNKEFWGCRHYPKCLGVREIA